MYESQNQLIEEWFELSEEELFEILMMEDSSEEQMENAIIVLEEKFDYSHEEILEVAPLIAAAGRAALGAGRSIASGVKRVAGGVKKTAGAVKSAATTADSLGRKIPLVGGVVGAGLDTAKNAYDIIGNNLNPFKKDYVVRSLDDFLPGMEHPADKKKKENDHEEQEKNKPLGFINKKMNPNSQKESYEGTTKMQKTFTQFREELSEEFFIEDLDDESLFYVLESEEYDETEKDFALLHLIERNEIQINEELFEYIETLLKEEGIADMFSKAREKVQQFKKEYITKPLRSYTDKAKTAVREKGADLLNATAGKDEIKRIQTNLKKSNPNLKVDGIAGPKTMAALKSSSPFSQEPKSQAAKPTPRPVSSGTPKTKSVSPAPVTKPVGKSTPSVASKSVAKPSSSSTKPAAPVKKSLPSRTKPSAAMNDLRQSVDKLRGTASAAATATNRAKTALSKVPGTGRMNKPTSRGGMSSSDIHSAIGKLGGEQTRPAKRIPTNTGPKMGSASVGRTTKSSPTGGKWM